MPDIDRTPRYAPKRVLVRGIHGERKFYDAHVQESVVYPPNQHPKSSPIALHLTRVDLITEYGTRHYGFEKAWINSELRLVVSGFGAKDEVRAGWEIVPDDDRRLGG